MLFGTQKMALGQSRPPAEALQKRARSSGLNTLGDDPLAASLTYLAGYHGRAVSREALLGGLPILDGRLSVALYDRAARRAGLETEAIKREIIDIPALVLPAVLIMKDGSAVILFGIDQTNKTAKVLDHLVKPSTVQIRPIGSIAARATRSRVPMLRRGAARPRRARRGPPPGRRTRTWGERRRP